MPGKIRTFDRRFIRLSDSTLASVEHLARLAGVTPADIVDFVLTEVLEGACLADHPISEGPALPSAPALRHGHAKTGTHRAHGPADVIPITRHRNRVPHPPARRAVALLESQDLGYLRQYAVELRGAARLARAHAADARRNALRARDRAVAALELARASH